MTAPPGPADRLDAWLRDVAGRYSIHHAVAVVESGDGTARWAAAVGDAAPGGPAMGPDTPYFIASVDKLFTAATVLGLCSEERLGLDEPITSYLPPSLTAGLHRRDGVDMTDRITVRHLLGHTSGLPDYLEDAPRRGRSLVDELAQDGDASWTRGDMAQRVRERLVPHFAPQPRDAARPRIRYSDTNYQLLAAILEAVTGESLEHLFRRKLFEPLGMRHTWMAGGAGPLDAAPSPSTLWFGPRPLVIPGAMASLGGIFSTAADTLRFLRALVAGRVPGGPAVLATMQERWRRFGVPRDRAALRAPNWPIEYGLGMMRFQLPRLLAPFRPVPAIVGHSGSTGTWLFHCPALDVYLAGSVDQATAGPVPFRFLPTLLRGGFGDGT
jgi:D-alanyl-D-alanine carboxypeptidase